MDLTVEEIVPLVIFSMISIAISISLVLVKFQYRRTDPKQKAKRSTPKRGSGLGNSRPLQIIHVCLDKGRSEDQIRRQLVQLSANVQQNPRTDLKQNATPPPVSVYESLLSPMHVHRGTCCSLPDVRHLDHQRPRGEATGDILNKKSKSTETGQNLRDRCLAYQKGQYSNKRLLSRECQTCDNQSRNIGHTNEKTTDWDIQRLREGYARGGDIQSSSGLDLEQTGSTCNKEFDRHHRLSPKGSREPSRRRSEERQRWISQQVSVTEMQPFHIARPALPTTMALSGVCVDTLGPMALCPPAENGNSLYRLEKPSPKCITQQGFRSRSVATDTETDEHGGSLLSLNCSSGPTANSSWCSQKLQKQQQPPKDLHTSLSSTPEDSSSYRESIITDYSYFSEEKYSDLRERCKPYPTERDRRLLAPREHQGAEYPMPGRGKRKQKEDISSSVRECLTRTASSQSVQTRSGTTPPKGRSGGRCRDKQARTRLDSEPDTTLTDRTAPATSTWDTY